MTSYKEIFENNRRWIESKTGTDGDFFKQLAKEQNPDYLYIGCCDSRVTAEDIMGLGPGEVFVHRNVANLVNSVDMNVLSVLNYAINHLKVKHIIVCGHYNCGGVKAAMQSEDMGILNPWLRSIRDIYRLHQEELDAITGDEARYNRLVELNVLEQCINIIKTATFQQSYFAYGFPKVHGWVFDIRTGKIIDLAIDFENVLKDIKNIYRLV